jgi:hypothetical protein
MICFTHPDSQATGVCKFCFKALCAKCAQDTPAGLGCSETCIKEIADAQLMMVKAKRVYGIGGDKKKISNAVAIYLFFGLGFAGLAAFQTIRAGSLDATGVALAVLFFVFALFVWYREKNSDIKC